MFRPIMWPKTLGLSLLLIVASVAAGQPAPDASQPLLPIDVKTRSQVIDKALQEIVENYVFPDVAEKMNQAVRGSVERKEYYDVSAGQELARRLTAHLQAVSKDKHLRVRCSTEKLPPEPPSREPTPEMIARMKKETQALNAGFRRVERLPGNVGYLALDGFMHTDLATGPAAAAMTFLTNTDAMILDLRQNGGGRPHTVALVCSYFFGERPVHLNSLYWRKGDRTDEFWTRQRLDGPRYLDKPVHVLTSKFTFSGAEECAYNLQTQKRATIVGETTGGGAHPGGSARIHDHFLIFVPSGRAINPITKTNWEGTGVKPDIAVPAEKALEIAHQKVIDYLLKKAPDDEARQMIREQIDNAKRREQPDTASGPPVAGPDTRPFPLLVGDPAPPVRVDQFFKGEPVHEFRNGTVYVVEFMELDEREVQQRLDSLPWSRRFTRQLDRALEQRPPAPNLWPILWVACLRCDDLVLPHSCRHKASGSRPERRLPPTRHGRSGSRP